MPLDNAALLYTASLSRKYASLYRLRITLSEEVSTENLQKALSAVIVRFPSFRYRLRKGFFWWYLSGIDDSPRLSAPGPLKRFSFKKNGGYLFRAGAEGSSIFLDVFHSLTDGFGAMTFLMSLTAEYLRINNGVEISYDSLVLDPREEPSYEEIHDCFDNFSGTSGNLEKGNPAYHIGGTVEKPDVLNNVRMTMPLAEIEAKAKEYSCTVTDFLVSVMLHSLQEVRSEDRRRRRLPLLNISVPVNLRNVFGGRTLRNYSSYVNLGVDVRNGNLSFEDIVKEVSTKKKWMMLPSQLMPKISANVSLEDNPAIRVIPRVIKDPIISIIDLLKGDRFCSHTLSNLGKIRVPEQMRPFVRDFDFILGRQRRKSGACACVSYGDSLNMNFSRRIREAGFERCFARKMRSLGVSLRMVELPDESEDNVGVHPVVGVNGTALGGERPRNVWKLSEQVVAFNPYRESLSQECA